MLLQFFLLIAVMLLSIFLNYIKFKKVITPANIFTLAWGGTLLLNFFYAKEKGLIVPSEKVFYYVIIGVLVFNVVYVLLSSKNIDRKFELEQICVNSNIIKILFWIAFLLMLPNFISSIRMLFSSDVSLSAVRIKYLNLVTSGQGVYVYLTNIIPKGIFNAIILVSIYELLKSNYKYLKYIIGALLVTSISFGGRAILLDLLLKYLIAFILFKKNNHIKFNKKIMSIIIFIIVIMTFSRGLITNFFDMIAQYFFEQYSFMQYIFDNERMFEINEGAILHNGAITFIFLLSPVYAIVSLFNENVFVPSHYVDIHSQIFYNISESGYSIINNNTTSLYPFILDFGQNYFFVGFILMALMLICIEKVIAQTRDTHKKTLYISIYIILLKNIFYSPIYYGLYSIGISFTIFFLIILNTRIRIVFGKKYV